jgi:hypothetical protein
MCPPRTGRNWSPPRETTWQSLGVSVSETGNFDCPNSSRKKPSSASSCSGRSRMPLGAALAEWRREVLGASDYASFALQHGVSPRVVQLLERHNRIPLRAEPMRASDWSARIGCRRGSLRDWLTGTRNNKSSEALADQQSQRVYEVLRCAAAVCVAHLVRYGTPYRRVVSSIHRGGNSRTRGSP